MAQKSISVIINNNSKQARTSTPVVIPLGNYGNVKSALVNYNNNEMPCQLDDIDGNGTNDELCFITDIDKNSRKTFSIKLYSEGQARQYPSQVYAEMLLRNIKIKESNKQDLYINSLTTDRNVNPYWMMHHHGAAFESNLVAYRIYFDHRQTVDIYGKYNKGLELKQTQFYPDKLQKANGYGDDILWVGETLGVGTLRGWDGTSPVMLKDVEHRSQKIISSGPLRTIIEIKDDNWKPSETDKPVTMTTLYTLYANHRDCNVDIKFSHPVDGYKFATGLINVKNSVEYSDKKGLRGCWGTDWPVSEKDSAGHKQETVGLGICIPVNNVVKEMPANKDNYPYIISTQNDELHYSIVFGSDNEKFGYHNAKEWFRFLKEWKDEINNPVNIKIAE